MDRIKEELMQRLFDLRGALGVIAEDLAEHGLSHQALGDFQAVVEGARNGVWGVLTAVNSKDYHGFVADCRLRRATDTFQDLLADIDAGRVTVETPGIMQLQDRLEDLLEAIPELPAPETEGSCRNAR